MKLKSISALAFAALLSVAAADVALAEAEQNLSQGLTGAGVGLAAHGYDTVAFFNAGTPTRGQAKFEHVHNGAAYRFASQANLDEFKASPAKFVPQFGGYCAYGVSVGKKFDGDPRYWKIEDGKLYFNLSADIYRVFIKDVTGNIAKAENSWRDIEHAAPADL